MNYSRRRCCDWLAWILGVALLPMCNAAPAETYDIFSFTPPAKWQRLDRDGFIVYTRPKDDYCQIGLYKAQANPATPAEVFAAIWANSVGKSSGVSVAGEHQDVGQGWTLSHGAARVQDPPMTSVLYVLSGRGIAGAIVTNVTDTKCQGEMEGFAGSLDLSPMATAAMPPKAAPPAASPPPTKAAAAPAGANPLLGVWWLLGFDRQLNTITNASGTNFSHFSFTSRAKVYRLAFFTDGSYTGSLPDSGLTDLREHRKRFPGEWGSYTVKGNKVQLTNAKGEKWQLDLRDGKLYISEDDYYLKTPNPQGARFRGSFAARGEPQLSITLGADGRFTDRGAIAWALNEANRTRYAGSGKYDVQFYTINFSYDDGRRVSVSLLSEGDPNTDSVRLGTGHPLERVK